MIKLIEDKELCIKLKEAGFDEGCIALFRGDSIQPVCQMDVNFRYDKNSEIGDETNYWLACPTYDQVVNWLNEKHNIHCFVTQGYGWEANVETIENKPQKKYHDGTFNSYEEALTVAIVEALKLI